MSLAQTATKSLDLLAAALHGLDAIAELAKGKVHSAERAIQLLSLITKVVDSIKDGFDGKVDAMTIHDGLLKLRTDLLANDANAESELDKKFPR